MNAVDQQEHVTFLKRLFFIFPREFALVEASARCTLPASFSAGHHYVSFQAMNEHETKIRPYMVCAYYGLVVTPMLNF